MAQSDLSRELQRIRDIGVVLPRNPVRAVESAREMQRMVKDPISDLKSTFPRSVVAQKALGELERYGRGPDGDSPEIQAIRANNAALRSAMGGMRRMASTEDVAVAIPRFYDPLEYWDLSGLPWNMADEGHRHKLHKWLRLYYATHRLVPSLIDIFTRYPLIGLELICPDKKITEFYEDLFLDQLKYEDFLVKLGREHWTVGEAYPLGSFNEALGIWEREELLNPEDIVIENYPMLGTRQIKVVPPEYLKRIATTKTPPEQYKQLEDNFPELLPYLKRGEPFPVSEVLLKQVAFKVTDWDDHGTPILLRGLRTLLHEEKLLASQDAIAERLYSPLILAKLGIEDMGDNQGPWIPGPDQLESFRDDMDMALAADFRMMVYHYGLTVENVFGREQMPDLGNDFDRVGMWLMQIFGLQGVMATGSYAQPYATSALNAEFMNQMLRTYQYELKQHMLSRMRVVAEAQGHYAYEKRGQTRVPIMEEVVEWDDNGDPHIVEKHKLLVPEPSFQSLDIRDEATQRQFLQSLRAQGVPISDEKMMVGVDFKFEDSLDEMYEETIQKTVAQQMAKLQTYKILRAQGLTIPPALQAEIEGTSPEGPGGPGGAGGPGGGMGGPGGGMGGPGGPGGPAAGPGGAVVMPPVPGGLGGHGMMGLPPGGASMGMPTGAKGMVPGISMERMPGALPAGMRPPALSNWARTAKVSSEELDAMDYMSDEAIDQVCASLQTVIDKIAWKKKMKTSGFERRRRERYFETEDISSLRVASNQKIVEDKVPPKVRQDIIDRYLHEAGVIDGEILWEEED